MIANAVSFTYQGQREYNEDYTLPLKPTQESKLFIVCDGMGGLDQGEIASKLTADSIYEFLEKREINAKTIKRAVAIAYEKLTEYIKENPLINRMGTTLTLVSISGTNAIIAHLGDSRVCHIRGNQILYKTKDHKQVLDMVEDGIINEEQAINHPWRNRLSKSISVKRSTEEEGSKNHEPTIHTVENIEEDDIFFLGSDGVFEQVTDEILVKSLNSSDLIDQKLQTILNHCENKTKDNYSGYLIEVKSGKVNERPKSDKSGNWLNILFATVIFLLFYYMVTNPGFMKYKNWLINGFQKIVE